MTKKAIRITAIVLIAILAVVTLSQCVLAATQDDFMSVNQFDDKVDGSGAATSMQNIIGAMITVVQVVGMGVAIIMLIVLAIKYISAAPGDKADIKKHAVVYVVGAVVLFAASGILGIVKNFAKNISAAS